MTYNPWTVLLAKLEVAMEGSRESDAHICAALCLSPGFEKRGKYIEGCTFEYEPDERGAVAVYVTSPDGKQVQYAYKGIAPRLTESLDAIVAVVKAEDVDITMDIEKDSTGALLTSREHVNVPDYGDIPLFTGEGHAPTPALALCIAFCRYKEATWNRKSD